MVTTTTFDGRVTAAETDDRAPSYSLTVRAPTLSAATEEKEEVGEAVEAGWYDTYERRLEDAPMAVRFDVGLEALGVTEEDGEVVAVFEFRWHNADQASDIAKAMASIDRSRSRFSSCAVRNSRLAWSRRGSFSPSAPTIRRISVSPRMRVRWAFETCGHSMQKPVRLNWDAASKPVLAFRYLSLMGPSIQAPSSIVLLSEARERFMPLASTRAP